MTLHTLKYLTFALAMGSALSGLGCDDDDNGGNTTYDSGWRYDSTTDLGSSDTGRFDAGATTDFGLDATASDTMAEDTRSNTDATDTSDALEATLTNGQIATVLHTVNTGEMTLANTEKPRLSTAQGQQYANRMVEDHDAAGA